MRESKSPKITWEPPGLLNLTHGRAIENKQIAAIRSEIEGLIARPEFYQMSKAFKHSLAQRLGLKEFKEGGLVIQAQVPITLRDILEDTQTNEPVDQLKERSNLLGYGASPYGNIYSYSFW